MKRLFPLFFWVFNATLLLIVYVGVLPFWGIGILQDTLTGQVPLNFFIPFLGLIGVPTASAITGFRAKIRQPITLFELFYGIEAPLLLVCLSRFFWFRDLTPATGFLLLLLLIGTVMTGHWLFSRRENLMQANLWHLGGQVLVLGLSAYILAIAAFYTPLLLAVSLRGLLFEGLSWLLLFSIIAFPLTILIAGLCSLPLGMAVMYGRSLFTTLQQLGTRYGEWRVRAFTSTVLVIAVVAVVLLQQQPQIEAFRLLASAPQTDQQRQALLQKAPVIRRGLLNAYLASYRYPRTSSNYLQAFYQTELNVPGPIAQLMQTGFNVLTAPFTYQGTPEDVERAARDYLQFFDAPLQRREQAAIQVALQSTFDRNNAKASLDDINQKRVWLEEQRIAVSPQGDWADVEIQEVYQNQTDRPQEVLYYFSLPESAAITGVWLSDDVKQPKKYAFTISPRGAAQQVYANQVRPSVAPVDPALLEQLGPQQYRLRAFPVPARSGTGTGEQPKLYLWLRYKVLKQASGWALPTLQEQRNVFWTTRTKRLINSQASPSSAQWLPATLPADTTPLRAHETQLPWGGYVLATPLAQTDYQLPRDKRFAVILDGSYSMQTHRPEVVESLHWLKDQILVNNSADLYLTTAAPAQPQRINQLERSTFDSTNVIFYGAIQPKAMLEQFQQLQSESQYDAIVVITDAGTYELNTDAPLERALAAPLWFVHLGGLALAYDDATLKAIQDSAGGVATQLQPVMQRLGTQLSRGMGTSFLTAVDHYAWFVTKEGAPPAQDPFAALAARQWITHLSHYLHTNDTSKLDEIHRTALKYGLVTPYSSMLVLVNNQQYLELNQAETQLDRFGRKVEDSQQLPPAQKLTVSATPEPAAWLLLLFAAAILWGCRRTNYSA